MQAGIPIWFYQSYENETQRLEIEAQQHVFKWLDAVEPPPTRTLPGYLCFVDAVPANPTIYTGVIRASLERYRLMADSIWNIAFPAAVFGPDVVSNVSYDSQSNRPDEVIHPPSNTSVVHSRSSSRTSTASTSAHTSSSPSTSSRASGKRKAEAPERRNKFFPVESPIMPVEIESWVTASKTIGKTFDNNQPERPGVSRKYVLPEPSLFAGHSDEGARQAMLKTFLKVREVLFYDISTRGTLNCLKSPQDWRRMMGLELHGQKSGKETRESRMRKKLRVDLQNAASSGPDISMVSKICTVLIPMLILTARTLIPPISAQSCQHGKVRHTKD